MKRTLIVLAGLCGILGIILGVMGVTEWIAGPLLIIGVIGLGSTVGGAAAIGTSD